MYKNPGELHLGKFDISGITVSHWIVVLKQY